VRRLRPRYAYTHYTRYVYLMYIALGYNRVFLRASAARQLEAALDKIKNSEVRYI